MTLLPAFRLAALPRLAVPGLALMALLGCAGGPQDDYPALVPMDEILGSAPVTTGSAPAAAAMTGKSRAPAKASAPAAGLEARAEALRRRADALRRATP